MEPLSHEKMIRAEYDRVRRDLAFYDAIISDYTPRAAEARKKLEDMRQRWATELGDRP